MATRYLALFATVAALLCAAGATGSDSTVTHRNRADCVPEAALTAQSSNKIDYFPAGYMITADNEEVTDDYVKVSGRRRPIARAASPCVHMKRLLRFTTTCQRGYEPRIWCRGAPHKLG